MPFAIKFNVPFNCFSRDFTSWTSESSTSRWVGGCQAYSHVTLGHPYTSTQGILLPGFCVEPPDTWILGPLFLANFLVLMAQPSPRADS